MKGKIIKISIIVLILMSVIFLIIFNNVSKKEIESANNNSENIVESLENNIVEENIISDIKNEEIVTEEAPNEVIETETNTNEEIIQGKTDSISTNVQVSSTKTIPNQTEEVKQVQEPVKQEVIIPNEPVVEQVAQPVPQVVKPQPQEKVETYQVNNSMIEKIKNTILNNESDMMKQYGYTVVVDSSIVNSSNQFTYTSERVTSMMTYRFGTIKIYARDYYVNGEFVWTESYIF